MPRPTGILTGRYMELATPINDRLMELAQAFHAHGHRLFVVGGPVRDWFIGRPIKDVDLTTDATPDQVRRMVGVSRPSAVYDVGARFGTIGMVYTVPDPSGGTTDATWGVEITTFRTEQYQDGTRKPTVQFGTSLNEDLARRDFTINAIAVNLLTGELHDPCGGRDDIVSKVVRAVGDADARFSDDPLRLLRGIRFVCELGFTLAEPTRAAIATGAAGLDRISRERIAAEMGRILVSTRPAMGLRLATDLGLMERIIPDVLPMRGMSQRPVHHKDVFEHTMGVVENIPAEAGLRWAALLHDIGKPPTKSVNQGAVHFFGHEEVGARMANRIMRSLNLDASLIARVTNLVRMHLRINAYEPTWTDTAVRRLIREVGDELDDLIALSRADVTSYRAEKVQAVNDRVDDFARRCRELQAAQDVARLQSPLDGDALMHLFGRGPGQWIRPVKDYLLGLVIDGELAEYDRERATELARAFLAAGDPT